MLHLLINSFNISFLVHTDSVMFVLPYNIPTYQCIFYYLGHAKNIFMGRGFEIKLIEHKTRHEWQQRHAKDAIDKGWMFAAII